jgi:hypothetical protein
VKLGEKVVDRGHRGQPGLECYFRVCRAEGSDMCAHDSFGAERRRFRQLSIILPFKVSTKLPVAIHLKV